MAKRRFVVSIERGDRWWVASIPNVQGCHTQGRNLEQTRRNIRECLAMLRGERFAESAELIEQVDYPTGVATALERLHKKAARVAVLQTQYEEQRNKLIRELAERGFSTHDVGALVGLSKPRVAQILNGR